MTVNELKQRIADAKKTGDLITDQKVIKFLIEYMFTYKDADRLIHVDAEALKKYLIEHNL